MILRSFNLLHFIYYPLILMLHDGAMAIDSDIQAIAILCKDTEAKVRPPEGDAKSLKILAGVLQGSTLAPFLFVIVLDYALRTAIDGNEHLGFTFQEQSCR